MVQFSWFLTSVFTPCLVNFRPLHGTSGWPSPSRRSSNTARWLAPCPRRCPPLRPSINVYGLPRSLAGRRHTSELDRKMHPSWLPQHQKAHLPHSALFRPAVGRLRKLPPQVHLRHSGSCGSDSPGLGARPDTTPHQEVCDFASQTTCWTTEALLLLHLLPLSTCKELHGTTERQHMRPCPPTGRSP